MKIHLVDDWKQAWKWFSVQGMALAATIQATWILIPDDLRSAVPQNITSGITIGLLALGVFGRVVRQGDKNVDNTAR